MLRGAVIVVERLRPGLYVNLIFEMTSPYLAMKASIYDVIGSRVVISQTSPPLLLSHLGKEVNVSFNSVNINTVTSINRTSHKGWVRIRGPRQ